MAARDTNSHPPDSGSVDDRVQGFIELGRMTAVVAHEIRNPLAGVSGALQIIGERLPPTVVEAAIFDEVQERLGALDRLVEQLLLLSRLDSPAPTRVSLSAILRDAPSTAGRALGQPAPVLEVEGPVDEIALAGEHSMLASMFGFVIAIAIEAQGPAREPLADEIGSARRVAVLAVERCGGDCHVRIGCGAALAADELAAGLEPFATLGGRGTGLCLVIARRIARLHGGDLVLESNGGTVAHVRLPEFRPAR